ncbi:MAG TPA: helix-turn-helix domain-containing protein, partial [Stellaceae bacterium]|nr:helix-turn-helix domain-containing protein [Stellaceae bacterium]
SVRELAAFLGLRDSTASQHLALLRKDGLVQARRDGQTIWYSIASGPAQRVLEALFESFCNPASASEDASARAANRARG